MAPVPAGPVSVFVLLALPGGGFSVQSKLAPPMLVFLLMQCIQRATQPEAESAIIQPPAGMSIPRVEL